MYRIKPKYQPKILSNEGFVTTKQWLPVDSEEKFLKWYDSKDPDFELYKNNPITYQYNEYGFRSDSFSDEIGNVFLGCSHTFGIGHHIENTWTWEVHQATGGGRYYNLAMPGSSIGMGYVDLARHINLLNIRNVFIFYPHRPRYAIYYTNTKPKKINNKEVYDVPKITYLNVQKNIGIELNKQETYIAYHNKNSNLYYEICLYGIMNLCAEKNIPCYMYDNPDWSLVHWQVSGCLCNPKEYEREKYGPHNAREGHWPVCYHAEIAKGIIRNYKNKKKPLFRTFT